MIRYFRCTEDFYMANREAWQSPAFKAGTVYQGRFNGDSGPTNKDLEVMASDDRMHQQDIYYKFTDDHNESHYMDWLTLLIYFKETRIKTYSGDK